MAAEQSGEEVSQKVMEGGHNEVSLGGMDGSDNKANHGGMEGDHDEANQGVMGGDHNYANQGRMEGDHNEANQGGMEGDHNEANHEGMEGNHNQEGMEGDHDEANHGGMEGDQNGTNQEGMVGDHNETNQGGMEEDHDEGNLVGMGGDYNEADIQRYCMLCCTPILKYEISYCQCGSVHHTCILESLRLYENQYPLLPNGDKIRCSYCGEPISIYPKHGQFVYDLLTISEWYQTFCDYAFIGIIGVCIAHVWLMQSFFIFNQFYEVNELSEIIGPLEPVETTTLCLLTQSSLMIINHGLCWENTLLQCLRRCSRLPVIGCLFPKEYPEVQEYPELLDISKKKVFSTVVGGLLLPYYAQVVGELFLYNVESRLHRYLLGGAAFIAARGAIYMYYKQALYKSKGDIRIVNYEDP